MVEHFKSMFAFMILNLNITLREGKANTVGP